MKVIEWFLNSVFSIAGLWDRSYDELLNEHRAYERRILIYTVMAATLITPSLEMQHSDRIKYATYILYKYIGMRALLFGAYWTIASLWNMAGLAYFRHKHGLTD